MTFTLTDFAKLFGASRAKARGMLLKDGYMQVLIVNDNPFELYKGKYYTSYSWAVFASKLADYFDTATLWTPMREIPDDYPIKGELFEPGRLKIVGNYYYTGFFNYYSNYLPYYQRLNRQAKALIKGHDITLVRISSPITPLIVKYSCRLRKPFVLIVAGDIATASNALLLSRGVKHALLQLILRTIKNRELRLARHASLVYAYGEELAAQFRKFCPRVKIMRDANISLTDIFPREDTCNDNTIRLLRVCWLGPCKGLEYLFKAIRLLQDRNLPVHLKILGREVNQQYSDYLKKMVQDLDIKDYVEFAGSVPYSEIFRVYQESDIQVISSTSEGIPRVILEGAANGLPLVSTSAGGCALAVRDGEDGILVPPGDPVALAEGIEQVIRDGALRRKIIQGGLEMAKRYSSEVVCQQIVNDFDEIVASWSS